MPPLLKLIDDTTKCQIVNQKYCFICGKFKFFKKKKKNIKFDLDKTNDEKFEK